MGDGGSSFNSAASTLLCTESRKNLCFDDLDGVNEASHHLENGKEISSGNGRSKTLVVLPCLSEDEFFIMVERETEHLPKADYLPRLRSGAVDSSARRGALDWIWKANAHHGYGEECFVLSVNYLDRFLSMHELPSGKLWTIQLLAVACLSLAAKMEEIEVPPTGDLQVGDPKYVFEGKTIQRMELLVLSSLEWRMQPHTPCTYIDFLIQKIIGGDQIDVGPLLAKALQVLIRTIKGIDFLEFRPSEIAAAIALFVSEKRETMDIEEAVSCFKPLQKGEVMKCLKMIHDLTSISSGSTTTVMSSRWTSIGGTASAASSDAPQSPSGVLEVGCLSFKSVESSVVVGSFPSSSPNTSETKRRKLDTETSSLGDVNKS